MPDAWRLIVDGPGDGPSNMAKDEAILHSVDRGLSKPTLRLYEWSIPTVSIGFLQDYEAFKNAPFPLVRRITGGRAVLHHIELTYAMAAYCEDPMFSGGIHGAYHAISRCIVGALNSIGVLAELAKPSFKRMERKSCFHAPSRHEVIVAGKKLAGSAQRRLKKAFLQHGSILFSVAPALQTLVFGADAVCGVTWVGAHSAVSMEDFKTALMENIKKGLNIRFVEETPCFQETLIEEFLKHTRYMDSVWNFNGIGGIGGIERGKGDRAPLLI